MSRGSSRASLDWTAGLGRLQAGLPDAKRAARTRGPFFNHNCLGSDARSRLRRGCRCGGCRSFVQNPVMDGEQR